MLLLAGLAVLLIAGAGFIGVIGSSEIAGVLKLQAVIECTIAAALGLLCLYVDSIHRKISGPPSQGSNQDGTNTYKSRRTLGKPIDE